MKSTSLYISLLMGIAACAPAQTASGPTLGWNISADGRSVRTIYGVPGASRLGPPVSLPDDLRILRLSPATSIGIATTGDPAWPVIYDVISGARTALDGVRSNPGSVTWSPAGTAFAIVYPADSWVQIFVAADSGYRLADEFAATGRVAVSDDGSASLLLAGTALQLRTAGGASNLSDGPVTAFTFLAGSTTPAFQTAAGLTVGTTLIPNIVDGDDTVYLGSPAKDRVVAIRSSGQATVFDSTGQILATDNCGALASSPDSIGRAGTLLLSVPDGFTGPMCLADAGANPRIYFVPPPRDLMSAVQ